jgi:hypothetical protein
VSALGWAWPAVAQSPADAGADPAAYEPGRVIVRYARGVSAGERAAVRRDADAAGVLPLDLARAEVLKLAPGASVGATVRDLENRDDVEFVQPDYVYQLEGIPSDTLFAQQWALNNTGQTVNGSSGAPDADIDAPEAWDVSAGSDSIVVGVLDSGVNTRHPDLAPNIFVNAAESGGAAGVDDDGNGRVDDINGFDFVNNNRFVSDDVEEHGTMVASVLGARGNNGFGVSGAAQNVRILPLQAATPLGGISTAAAANAIAYARAMGARVINMSFGNYTAENPTLTAAIDASPGILFTTSAGNEAANNDATPHWPSQLTLTRANVIAVANSDKSDGLSASSSYGAASVDLAAPGADIAGAQVPVDSTPVFSESFDGALSGWSLGGWAVTNERAHSGPNSLADSPGGTYAANADETAESPTFAFPADSTFCFVEHRRRRRLQVDADFYSVRARVGVAGLVTIERISEDSAGTGFAFGTPGFARNGAANASVAFRLTSDATVASDGVHIDDVAVKCGPTAAATYRFADGTSFSSPMAAGVAALMLSVNPGLTPGDLKALLRANADPVAALAGKTSTGARLNANRAVRAAVPPAPPPPPSPPLPPPPSPPPLPDLRAATIGSVSLSPFAFRALRAGATVRLGAAAFGSRLRFRVDEPVRARLQIHRRLAGRRVGRLCLAPTRARLRRPACTRYLAKGTYSIAGQVNGYVRRVFAGRMAGRALPPGPYRLTLQATDLAGNRSLPVRRNFRIVLR